MVVFPQVHRNIAPPRPIMTAPSPSQAQELHIQGQWQGLPLASLTGDVYELTVDDARMIAMSEQISGRIWLTDTYENSTSFITIPISHELTGQFIIQRPRVM